MLSSTSSSSMFFFFNAPPTTEIYTLSLHDALPILPDLESGNILAKQLQYLAGADSAGIVLGTRVPIVLTSRADPVRERRSEEHTSELQSRFDLVCRLLLEKKKKKK